MAEGPHRDRHRVEDDTEHLARLGRQVPLFDLPDLDPRKRGSLQGLTERMRAFTCGARDVPPVAAQQVLASFPTLPERMLLVARSRLSVSVLHRLATDPSPVVRGQVARHSKVTSDLLATMAASETDLAVVGALLIHHRSTFESITSLLERVGQPLADFPIWVRRGIAMHPDQQVRDLRGTWLPPTTFTVPLGGSCRAA